MSHCLHPSHVGNASILGVNASQLLNIDALGLKVLVALKWVIRWVPAPVWWPMILLEGSVLVSLLLVGAHLPLEVSLGEQTVGWAPVVVGGWLVVVQVGEAGGVGVREVEWHVGVSVVDAVQLLALHEGLYVVLHDWALGEGGMLCSSGVHIDGISKGENVGKSLVLKGVWVDINESIGSSNTSINELLLRN